MKYVSTILAVTLAPIFTGAGAAAQTAPAEPPAHRILGCPAPTTESIHTFYLHNVSQTSDANEVYTALRNMLPADVKSYLVSSQNAIFMCGTPELFTVAQKIISD